MCCLAADVLPCLHPSLPPSSLLRRCHTARLWVVCFRVAGPPPQITCSWQTRGRSASPRVCQALGGTSLVQQQRDQRSLPRPSLSLSPDSDWAPSLVGSASPAYALYQPLPLLQGTLALLLPLPQRPELTLPSQSTLPHQGRQTPPSSSRQVAALPSAPLTLCSVSLCSVRSAPPP